MELPELALVLRRLGRERGDQCLAMEIQRKRLVGDPQAVAVLALELLHSLVATLAVRTLEIRKRHERDRCRRRAPRRSIAQLDVKPLVRDSPVAAGLLGTTDIERRQHLGIVANHACTGTRFFNRHRHSPTGPEQGNGRREDQKLGTKTRTHHGPAECTRARSQNNSPKR